MSMYRWQHVVYEYASTASHEHWLLQSKAIHTAVSQRLVVSKQDFCGGGFEVKRSHG
jgi:hypothetical protein